MLVSYPEEKSIMALERALSDDESLIRHAAIRTLIRHAAIRTLNRFNLDETQRIRLTVPLLYDPVKAVRVEAALCLSPVPKEKLKENERKLYQLALEEYKNAMMYTGDFPQSQFNLGLLYANLGDLTKAEAHYKKSINIDDVFVPAKVNLAMLYNRKGLNDQAEELLKEAYESNPDMHELAYSLGLLLVEKKEPKDAVHYLSLAAEGMPNNARVHYNLGLLLQSRRQLPEAETYLLHALNIEPDNMDYLPDNMDYLYAVADHYLKRNMPSKAHLIAKQMILRHPDERLGHDLLEFINRKPGNKFD